MCTENARLLIKRMELLITWIISILALVNYIKYKQY